MPQEIVIEVPGTKISELDETSSVNAEDVMPVVQNGETKKAPLNQVADLVKAGLGSAALKNESDFATPASVTEVSQASKLRDDAQNERIDKVEFEVALAQAGVEASFDSYAKMLAYTPTKPNVSVRVNSDADPAKVGTYTWDGTQYIPGMDLVSLIKNWANSNPNFKLQILTGPIDFNTLKKPGQYAISTTDFVSSTNKPPFDVGGIIIVEGSGADYFTRHRFCSIDNLEAVRVLKDTWGAWDVVVKASDLKAKAINEPIDFDTFKTPGTYTITTAILLQCSHKPPVTAGGTFEVKGTGANYLTAHIFRSYDNIDASRAYKTSWGAWDVHIKASDLKPKVVSSAIDFNAFNVPGPYSITNNVLAECTNGPPTPNGGIFQNFGTGAAYYTHREYVSYKGEFFKQSLETTWGPWKKLATTDVTDALAKLIASIQIPGTSLADKKWLAIGDSITYGLNNTDNRSYADILATRYGAVLTKHAFSGAWISSGTGAVGPAPILSQSYTSLPNDAFDLITIAAGTNDRIDGVNGNLGTFADRTNETFYGALHVLIAGLKSKYPNARMLFISQIPRTGFRFTPTDATEGIDKKFKAISEVCDYYGVPIWAGHKNFGFHPDDNATFRTKKMPDGLHPSDEGQIWYANRLEQPILSLAK
ncbi:GDSL-type esterase/lipase family protein [Acinetobacter baumannii]|uniref:GDSL-type esterase/lipase family protein n=1 Tax=Acinetobacter baumannii TaxID=470 RepID=UPI0022EC202D|nr:GDSL-type esterase/lipase family protein [Acinetobacter baumannii]MDA4907674.1 GDSL-type esterase/lipase family protein [Acinetobacter baumannii]MDA4911453.1 GDSL-type esterase/lipase family protein [Acinetobacter baumannii]MDA4936921.1 GDSL-type esterase/lipase family protein [Acinetobacter baumannii]MDA4947752.1 GDSL-type esterase/lipase family protein [Acinetobacter baumannii]